METLGKNWFNKKKKKKKIFICEFSLWLRKFEENTRNMSTCLCVGPRNAGKTMLMTSIQYPDSVNFTTHSVNTVGTNIYTINYIPSTKDGKPSKKNPKKSINVRELGGEMAVMWKSYYNESVDKIIFVVDTSNLCQISSCG